MFKEIMNHELKNILFSPKFTAAFIACTALILLSIGSGIQRFKSAVVQYETVNSLNNQEMREQKSFMSMSTKVSRTPNPMQIFAVGVNDDIGRLSNIGQFVSEKLTNSFYTDDPIYSVFRFVDFSFIVTVVLSLLALLFTYDLINGELETGTLQLVFSNSLPRGKFILAKFSGVWIALIAILLIPMLLSILMLLLFSVPVTASQWAKIAGLYFFSLLLFTFFISFGTMISCFTKRSQTSFLIALVCWICFVFIIPRLGVVLAGQINPVPSMAETESQRDSYAKDAWQNFFESQHDKWRARNEPTQNMSEEERSAYQEEHNWEWMEEDDKLRKNLEAEIDKYNKSLLETVRNKKAAQEKIAFSLSRISPVSAYQISTMNLASTDIGLKSRYEDAISDYRTIFNAYRLRKNKESGGTEGIQIAMSSDGSMKISAGQERGRLDISDMPAFAGISPNIPFKIMPVFIDCGIILLSIALSFIAAFKRFQRYEIK